MWKSAHAHAPVTVSAQPQLFSKLNVEESVRKFARGSRGFWRSREFQDSLHRGDIVKIDPDFFTEVRPREWRNVRLVYDDVLYVLFAIV